MDESLLRLRPSSASTVTHSKHTHSFAKKWRRLPDLRTPQNANDFVFVDDVAKAFSNAVSNEFPSGIYNLGSGGSTPVQEICRIAEQIVLGTDSLTRQLEENTQESFCNVDFWADCSNAKKSLDWDPTTDLSVGIEKTWKWLTAK